MGGLSRKAMFKISVSSSFTGVVCLSLKNCAGSQTLKNSQRIVFFTLRLYILYLLELKVVSLLKHFKKIFFMISKCKE